MTNKSRMWAKTVFTFQLVDRHVTHSQQLCAPKPRTMSPQTVDECFLHSQTFTDKNHMHNWNYHSEQAEGQKKKKTH